MIADTVSPTILGKRSLNTLRKKRRFLAKNMGE